MNIVFRADSSVLLGSGHLIRCLTLANLLYQQGCTIHFIARDWLGNFNQLIVDKGYSLYLLPRFSMGSNEANSEFSSIEELCRYWEIDAGETKSLLSAKIPFSSCLVVDHYALDIKWETVQRPYTKKIFVIDDLADRRHDCDLLFDQNLVADYQKRYQQLIPNHCRTFLGPEYALLRTEFQRIKREASVNDGVIQRIFVFFGGTDPTHETEKVLSAVQKLNDMKLQVDVVVGKANPQKEEIRELCLTLPNIHFYCQVENMAELMSQADLVIGAGGTNTWERCYLGLPSITIKVAANQVKITEAVASVGATWDLGLSSQVTSEQILAKLKEAISQPWAMREMSMKAKRLMGDSVFLRHNLIINAIMDRNQ